MEQVAKAKWFWDRETGEHILPVTDDLGWKVYKTAAGDYALTLHSYSAGHGDEIEYFDTLKAAKHAAASRAGAA